MLTTPANRLYLSRVTHRGAAVLALSLVAIISGAFEDIHAQDEAQAKAKAKEEPKLGWSNTSDLSLVVVAGNSQSTTVGLSDTLQHASKNGRFEFEVNMVRADKSDDHYFLVEPGIEFPVAGAPSNPAISLIKPEPEPDVANYQIRGGYERKISPKWFWNAGASWYRNDDANILNRYIVFAGVGNTWADNQRRRFVTSYGVSYTDREEEVFDPEKDHRFGGARAGWDYTDHLNAATTFDSDFALNSNFSDPSDYSISTLNALTVSMNERVSLKVSLQWLFENEPALEAGLDIVAYVELLNPDGIPGSGDERFRTLSSGGTKLVLGSADARKDRLDTVVRTALVIKF